MTAEAKSRPRVVLCFSDAYAETARLVGKDLRHASLAVFPDQWEGGGGLPGRQSVTSQLIDCVCVIALLTPSHTASTWIGLEWLHDVRETARQRGTPVLLAKCAGEDDSVPDFARSHSYARLEGEEYPEELRRLLKRIRKLSGNVDIVIPEEQTTTAYDQAAMAPLAITLSSDLSTHFLSPDIAAAFREKWIPFMRDGLFYELGVKFPAPAFDVDDQLPSQTSRISIYGVPELEFPVDPQRVLVNERVEGLEALGIPASHAINPANQARCAWIASVHSGEADQRGFTTWDKHQYLILQLSALLRRRAAAFVDSVVADRMLHQVAKVYPGLVEQCVPRIVPRVIFADVMRRLVDEEVSVRDQRTILMALAYWGRREKDPMHLTEQVRAALKRQISYKFGLGANTLPILLLDPAIENSIANAMRYTATGSYVDMAPETLAAISAAINEPMRYIPDDCRIPPILTTIEIRAFVRRLVAYSLPNLYALSYHELLPGINLQPVGRVALDGFHGGRATGPRGETI